MVSGDTLVMLVMKSSRYLHACSKWVVFMMIWTNCKTNIHITPSCRTCFRAFAQTILNFTCRNTKLTSVSPIWGFLMRFCKQPLSVLVRSRLVDLRSMSSISVELKGKMNQLRNAASVEQCFQGTREHVASFSSFWLWPEQDDLSVKVSVYTLHDSDKCHAENSDGSNVQIQNHDHGYRLRFFFFPWSKDILALKKIYLVSSHLPLDQEH